MNNGDMQVWWIPQIPANNSFRIPVKTLDEAYLIIEVLSAYDNYQFKNHINPDYSNVGGLVVWDEDADGEGNPAWIDWHGDDDEGFDEWCEKNKIDRYNDYNAIGNATKENGGRF